MESGQPLALSLQNGPQGWADTDGGVASAAVISISATTAAVAASPDSAAVLSKVAKGAATLHAEIAETRKAPRSGVCSFCNPDGRGGTFTKMRPDDEPKAFLEIFEWVARTYQWFWEQ